MGLARNSTADSIDNTNAKSTPFETITHSQDGVGRFAGLRHKDADVVTEDWSLAIKEVGGEFDGNWDFSEFFEDGSSLRRSMSSSLRKRAINENAPQCTNGN